MQPKIVGLSAAPHVPPLAMRVRAHDARPHPRLARARARARARAVTARALVKQTGVDETIPNVPDKVNKSFAIDLGGDTPAVTTLRFPITADAVCIACERPLGMFLEQRTEGSRTSIVVDEVEEGSNAHAAGARVGDVLRLTTAVFEVSAPVDVTTWLNPPAKRKVRAYYTCDNKSFDAVMDAIASHAVPIDTPSGKEEVKEVGMILERAATA